MKCLREHTQKYILCVYECLLKPLYGLLKGAFVGLFDIWQIQIRAGGKAVCSSCAFKGDRDNKTRVLRISVSEQHLHIP